MFTSNFFPTSSCGNAKTRTVINRDHNYNFTTRLTKSNWLYFHRSTIRQINIYWQYFGRIADIDIYRLAICNNILVSHPYFLYVVKHQYGIHDDMRYTKYELVIEKYSMCQRTRSETLLADSLLYSKVHSKAKHML